MPIILCSECNKTVSTKLDACPHCGAPMERETAETAPPPSSPQITAPEPSSHSETPYRFSVPVDLLIRCSVGTGIFAVSVFFVALLFALTSSAAPGGILVVLSIWVWRPLYRVFLRKLRLRPPPFTVGDVSIERARAIKRWHGIIQKFVWSAGAILTIFVAARGYFQTKEVLDLYLTIVLGVCLTSGLSFIIFAFYRADKKYYPQV